MLFKRRVLDAIAEGTITRAFRRWRRPTVKPGTQLRTAAGVIAIDAIEAIAADRITPNEARLAGFSSPAALLLDLRSKPDTKLYRIKLHFVGRDPRVVLRDRTKLTPENVADVSVRLARLDKASRRGPWTRSVLELIKNHPATRAAELAAMLGRDTPSLKADIRKLKELGLTESLEIGYRLSPRGRALLKALT
jgi:hypothetical protein